MIEQFKKDIENGMSSNPKTLPSKYFYDKIGDDLFVQIMDLPEYYLTRSELEIFTTQTQQIIDALQVTPNTYFELIELGAGDGLKTKKLLEALDKQHYKFDFFPVDISQNALDTLEETLKTELPTVSVNKKQGDYFQILESLKKTHHPKVILFLGSNMGNMSDEVARDFIYELGKNLNKNNKLLLGVDLIKSASIVLPAYNDSEGITKAFNLNLLQRINNELGGFFNMDTFSHHSEYTEKEGVAKSFLVSNAKQTVHIKTLNKTFQFEKGEKIATEISRKYNDEILNKIIENTDFQITKKLTDSKEYFANYVLNRGENEN